MEKKINDTTLMKFFNLPSSTITDWKKRDENDWRYKIYQFLKKHFDISEFDDSANQLITRRTVTEATRIYALKKIFEGFDKNDVGRIGEIFDEAKCFGYRNFDLKEFEAYKTALIVEISSSITYTPKFKNKSINFISALDINSYILVWDFFNNCAKVIK